jgi:hypothetical protein
VVSTAISAVKPPFNPSHTLRSNFGPDAFMDLRCKDRHRAAFAQKQFELAPGDLPAADKEAAHPIAFEDQRKNHNPILLVFEPLRL